MFSWFRKTPPAGPLQCMRLGAEGRDANPLMIQFFTWDCLHPTLSWWNHFEAEIPHLAELGFTQVWLPPPHKAAAPEGRGYDAYDLWDLGEFDQKGTVATRWGTREELLRACETARKYGIDILIDAVLNHRLGGDRVESFLAVPVSETNRLRNLAPSREIQGWTAFDFPGRGNKFSSFRWTQEHFTGVDWDQKSETKGIFRILGPHHKGWSRNVSTELGNYDYLLGVDIDHRHPAVQDDLISWGQWVLETSGALGFRLDAIKHIDYKFLLHWIQETRRRSGLKDMFVVSEYWSGNIKELLPLIKSFKGECTFFDVPLHMNFHRASRERIRYDLRAILRDTIVKVRPDHAVTFVDNHDTVEGQSLESWVGHNFKIQAYAIILLRGSGHPCVFYGDLYPTYQGYDRNTARDLSLLIEVRRKFAYGPTVDYPAERNCVGFVRKGTPTHGGCAVVLSNKESSSDAFLHELRMNVGVENAGSTYRSYLTKHGRVEIDGNGWGIFSCFAHSVQVWTKEVDEEG